jgi:N-acetylmuramoyl-L-alanine amidase
MRFLLRFLLPILLINNTLPMLHGAVFTPYSLPLIVPPSGIETVGTKIRLHSVTSPDRNYLAYEIYGSSLFIEVLETGEVRDLGEGNRPVWDDAGRLHFINIIENEDHSEEVIYHMVDPATGQRSILPEGAPRPEFVPTPPTPAARAKRMVPSTASVTGLSGWSIFLDQGHSRTENQGLYNYSEAEKVLRIGLHLRQMLLEQTDIDTVFVARTTDNDLVGLTQRTDIANALGANFYYSIHSNAGSPSTNNTLMLWGANGQGVEKIPNGGKKMGDIMIQDLTAAMRIPTIGSRADSPFYGATTRTTPYLSVNRNSTMASVLSEGGFHTNPTQQQRNLNAEWKKLEAQSAFWSILRYHGLSRPKVGILTGIVSNVESGRPINGATVTVGDRVYTTDTFESLFNRYSNNPDELANGFYYMENFTPGANLSVSITAPGFRQETRQITLRDTTFTFLDVGLISTVPPSVVFSSVANGALNLVPGDPILIRFSRPMKRDSVIANIRITNGTLQPNHRWISNTELEIRIASEFLTDVTITITEGAEDNYENALIPFSLSYRTRPEDMTPPQIIAISPEDGSTNVDQLTIISVTYDEPLAPDLGIEFPIRVSIAGRQDSVVMRAYQVFTVGNRSMIQVYPAAPLQDNTDYEVTVVRGISDRFGNRTASVQFFEFSTGSRVTQRTVIDAFASVDSWWVPQQSGSTTGIQTEQTSRTARQPGFPMLSGGNAMHLNYGWLADGPDWLIREYMIPSASNNLRFNKNRVLQAYILGDGSGVRFRFMLRDGNNQLEGSPWIPITWIGWKKVEWDLRPGISTPWVNGNGVLDGTLYTDSFQLTHTTGNPLSGSIAIDDYAHVDVVAETSVDRGPETVDRFELQQNYPNPFNPSTAIRFSLRTSHIARLSVFDVLGREIAVLVDGALPAGSHQVTFNGEGLASGVYLVRLTAGNEVRTIRMMLLK